MTCPTMNVRSSVVARRPDGMFVIALFDTLPAPLQAMSGCVVVLECSEATATALCEQLTRGSRGGAGFYG